MDHHRLTSANTPRPATTAPSPPEGPIEGGLRDQPAMARIALERFGAALGIAPSSSTSYPGRPHACRRAQGRAQPPRHPPPPAWRAAPTGPTTLTSSCPGRAELHPARPDRLWSLASPAAHRRRWLDLAVILDAFSRRSWAGRG